MASPTRPAEWTFQHSHRGGRPKREPDIELLIVWIARENPAMGYGKIQGELLKLGFNVHPSTVKNVLRRNNLLPAPLRGHSSWRTFLKHYRQHILVVGSMVKRAPGCKLLSSNMAIPAPQLPNSPASVLSKPYSPGSTHSTCAPLV